MFFLLKTMNRNEIYEKKKREHNTQQMRHNEETCVRASDEARAREKKNE